VIAARASSEVIVVLGSAILIGLSFLAILAGIVFSLTVIGAVIGIPFIVVGVLGLIAESWEGGGVFFALLFGAGVGYSYYRYRMRRLLGRMRQRSPLPAHRPPFTAATDMAGAARCGPDRIRKSSKVVMRAQARGLSRMTGAAGLEPATPGFGDRCSAS
jgi:hypothetical protein